MKDKIKSFNRNKFTNMEEKNIFLLCGLWFQLLKVNVTGVLWVIPANRKAHYAPEMAESRDRHAFDDRG
jgi:uncharacterized membrane protein